MVINVCDVYVRAFLVDMHNIFDDLGIPIFLLFTCICSSFFLICSCS